MPHYVSESRLEPRYGCGRPQREVWHQAALGPSCDAFGHEAPRSSILLLLVNMLCACDSVFNPFVSRSRPGAGKMGSCPCPSLTVVGRGFPPCPDSGWALASDGSFCGALWCLWPLHQPASAASRPAHARCSQPPFCFPSWLFTSLLFLIKMEMSFLFLVLRVICRKCHLYCCSVCQSCPTLCDPMDCCTPGFPVPHRLPELAQTHVHWVSDAIQPSCPFIWTSNCTCARLVSLSSFLPFSRRFISCFFQSFPFFQRWPGMTSGLYFQEPFLLLWLPFLSLIIVCVCETYYIWKGEQNLNVWFNKW